MEPNKDLSIENRENMAVLIVTVILTYIIAGFLTTCLCGIAYLMIV